MQAFEEAKKRLEMDEEDRKRMVCAHMAYLQVGKELTVIYWNVSLVDSRVEEEVQGRLPEEAKRGQAR